MGKLKYTFVGLVLLSSGCISSMEQEFKKIELVDINLSEEEKDKHFNNANQKFIYFYLLPDAIKKEIFQFFLGMNSSDYNLENLRDKTPKAINDISKLALINKESLSLIKKLYLNNIDRVKFKNLVKKRRDHFGNQLIVFAGYYLGFFNGTEEQLINRALDWIEDMVDFDYQDDYGRTALMGTSFYDRPEIIELLIKKGAKLDLQDKEGKTALIIASEHGCIVTVKLLVDAGANPNLYDCNGTTAIIIAFLYNYIQVVKLLIDTGVNLNLKNNSGQTIFSLAKNEEAIKFLKSIKYPNEHQLRDLKASEEIAKYVNDYANNNKKYFPELITAIESNNFGEIKKLLKMPTYLIDLDTGNNALHIAAQLRNLKIFKFILSLRPDLIKKKNYNGKTPFDLNQEMLILLILDYQENKVENKNNN